MQALGLYMMRGQNMDNVIDALAHVLFFVLVAAVGYYVVVCYPRSVLKKDTTTVVRRIAARGKWQYNHHDNCRAFCCK